MKQSVVHTYEYIIMNHCTRVQLLQAYVCREDREARGHWGNNLCKKFPKTLDL